MSNLKLLSTKFEEIKKTKKFQDREGLLGYKTTALYSTRYDSVIIRHHSSVIAAFNDKVALISNVGYGTPTTRNRLNRIMHDNDIPYTVSQHNFKQILVPHDDWTKNVWNGYSATFVKEDGVWNVCTSE